MQVSETISILLVVCYQGFVSILFLSTIGRQLITDRCCHYATVNQRVDFSIVAYRLSRGRRGGGV